MASIERNSPIPLYYQLKQVLVDRIASGEWRPGDMLPTEEKLTEEYNLSRTTVRQALKELELEGLISRYRGRGTFVARPKLSHSPDPHYSLTDFLLQQGAQPGWRILSTEWLPVPAEVAKRLEIKPGTDVYCLRRLRLADDEPIGYHIAYVVPAFAEAIEVVRQAQGGSLHYLSGGNHLVGSTATRIIEAVPAPAQVAEMLEIDTGSPLLQIRRVVVSRDGRPIEELQAMYRGDRFQYHIRQREGLKR